MNSNIIFIFNHICFSSLICKKLHVTCRHTFLMKSYLLLI
nr:MAG TPA_asm: hypothetical protein [Caudoviricetes sp.]